MRSGFYLLSALALLLGIRFLQLDTDILGLLPESVPSVKELRRLNAQLSQERSLLLLIQPEHEDGVIEPTALNELQAAAQKVPGTQQVTDAFTQTQYADQFPALLAYLWLNQPPASFQQSMMRSQDPNLSHRVSTAYQQLQTSLDPIQTARAGWDPLGLTDMSLLQHRQLRPPAHPTGGASALWLPGLW
jgi:predicted RND superfamily exporter protein